MPAPLTVIGLTPDLTYLASGPEACRVAPTPELDDFAELLERTARRFGADGVLLLDAGACQKLGLPTAENASVPALKVAADAGWQISPWRSWVTCRREGQCVRVAIGPMCEPRHNPLMVPDDMLAWTTYQAWFHHLTGGSFHFTPGATGLDLLRDVYPRARTRHEWVASAPACAREALVSSLSWHRPLLPVEHEQHMIVSFDANAAYLAAAGNAMVAPGRLTHTGDQIFDPKLAGYWQVEVPRWSHKLAGILPPPWPEPKRKDRTAWVTTPTVQHMVQLCVGPHIIDSWTAPSSRVFQTWANRLRDARAAALRDPAEDASRLVQTIKAVYAQTTNAWMGRSGSSIYRRDWQDTIIALGRANTWRKIFTAATDADFAMVPCGVLVDEVFYPVIADLAEPFAPAGYKRDDSGVQLGHIKRKRAVPLSDWPAFTEKWGR